jgi:hypothetical protein
LQRTAVLMQFLIAHTYVGEEQTGKECKLRCSTTAKIKLNWEA